MNGLKSYLLFFCLKKSMITAQMRRTGRINDELSPPILMSYGTNIKNRRYNVTPHCSFIKKGL